MCQPPPAVRRLAYANMVLAPIGLLGGGGLATSLLRSHQADPSIAFLAFIGFVYALIGMAVLAPLLFAAGWGMLRGRSWGLRVARVIWAAGAVFMTLSIMGIPLGLVSGVMWVSHHRDRVRAWFDPTFWTAAGRGAS